MGRREGRSNTDFQTGWPAPPSFIGARPARTFSSMSEDGYTEQGFRS